MRKNINICAVKKCDTIIWAPAKKCQRGGEQEQKYPQHTEKMASTWREKTAHIEKIPPWGNPPPPHKFFLFMPPPLPRASAYSSPPGERRQ